LERSKRWGFKVEPDFSLYKRRSKGGGVTSADSVLGDFLGREIPGLVEFKPRGESFRYVFPLEFRRRYGSFSGEWVCTRIGSGGFSTVYLCCLRDYRVALKVPRGFESLIEAYARGVTPSGPVISERDMDALLREIEVASALEHPHLLKLLAYHVDRGGRGMFLVYEYATHGSLKYQLEERSLTSTRDILVLAIQLADALRYLHTHGIIHGDVKPSNILFVNRVAKLGDYSTAIRTLDTRKQKIPPGTPGWRAPEQVDRELGEEAVRRGYQHKVDVYQLGNLILYSLTGENIDGEKLLENEDALEKATGKLGDQLGKLIEKTMSKNPWERPSLEGVIGELINIYSSKLNTYT